MFCFLLIFFLANISAEALIEKYTKHLLGQLSYWHRNTNKKLLTDRSTSRANSLSVTNCAQSEQLIRSESGRNDNLGFVGSDVMCVCQSQEPKNSGVVGASLCAVTNDMIWRGLSSCLFSLLAVAST